MNSSIKKIGAAAILVWAVLFISVFIFKSVPAFSHSSASKAFSFIGTFVHAEDGGGSDGGNDGGAGGDGGGGVDAGGNNGGSADANGSAGADGGGCGGCGGDTGGGAAVDTAAGASIDSAAGANNDGGGSLAIAFAPPAQVVIPQCPSGTSGTYPNCVTPTPLCPAGTSGIYPNCVVPTPKCPAGTSGVYPNCVAPTPKCPTGTTGTYPNCVTPTPLCPAGTSGTYPNCVVPTPNCPAGTSGTYPDCKVPTPQCPTGTSGTYPVCTTPQPVCPSGTNGTYPNCIVPTPNCPSGTYGTYPNCYIPTPNCPSGMTGTYPNCVVPTPKCPTNTTGSYPYCVVQYPQCPVGMSGYYPNCTRPYTPPVSYTYPVCTITTSNQVVSYGQSTTVSWSAQNAVSGWIEKIGSVGTYGSVVVRPERSTNYVGHFTDRGGQSVVCSAQVMVQMPFIHGPQIIPPQANVPFVTLSQVPYTGLDLGPFGTFMYFVSLTLWCLYMTYLVVIKKIHIAIAQYLNSLFFKSSTASVESEKKETTPVQALPYVMEYKAPKEDAVDEFIMQQIHRS